MDRPAPGDREGWAVYADWLIEQGDPRGEVIAELISAVDASPVSGGVDLVYTVGMAHAMLGEQVADVVLALWLAWTRRRISAAAMERANAAVIRMRDEAHARRWGHITPAAGGVG